MLEETGFAVDPRFCGPPDSGNGGYVAGRLAAHLPVFEGRGDREVRLHMPPPLGRPLEVRSVEHGVGLWDEDALVASARGGEVESEGFSIPDAPSPEEATEAARRFSGYALHWFPGCFVCGPERAAGDGLRIFPGPLGEGSHDDDAVVAAPWEVGSGLAGDDDLAREEFVWAALDCAGAFAFPPDPERTLVLGSLTARIEARPRVGEQCIVAGWQAGIDGRKYFAGTAVFDGSGTRVGVARATWIRIPQPAGSTA